MAEFSRASDAVNAALSFQATNAAHNEELADDVRPVLRVGIAYYLRGLQIGSGGSYAGDILDRFSRAKGYFEQALSLDPEFADALAQLSIVHTFLSYYGPTSSGSMEEAGDYAERAVIQDIGNATAHSVLGMYLHDSGSHERAAHHFEQAMKLNPNQTLVLAQYAI